MNIVKYLTSSSVVAFGISIAALAAAAATVVSSSADVANTSHAVIIVPGAPISQSAASASVANRSAPISTSANIGTAANVYSSAAIVALAAFNNGKPANGATWFGATSGDGKNTGSGWPGTGDMQSMTDLGLHAIRMPILPQYSLNSDGTINQWVVNHLTDAIKFNMSKGVATVLDAHIYLPFTDPKVASFWKTFAPAMEKSLGGPSPLFGIELSNEPGGYSKDLTAWTKPLATTISTIRAAGYQGYIFAGAGDWNNATFLPTALATISKPTDMDPLNRTIYTMHDYWEKDADPAKTRNDLGTAVDGTIDVTKRYDPALNAARKLGVKILMSEIGGGISPEGALPPYQGIGKDGARLEAEYMTYANANRDVLIGSWFWMGGRIGSYRHKVEAGNQHTIALQRGMWLK